MTDVQLSKWNMRRKRKRRKSVWQITYDASRLSELNLKLPLTCPHCESTHVVVGVFADFEFDGERLIKCKATNFHGQSRTDCLNCLFCAPLSMFDPETEESN